MTPARYWNLLRELTLSQLKLKDQSSLFGFLWSFLNPLLFVLVLFVIFQSRLAQDIQYYPLYLLIGVIHYNNFANSTQMGMHSLSAMRQLTNEAVFPKEILVIGSVLANSVEFLIEMGIVILVALVMGLPLTTAIVFLPLVLCLQIMLVLVVSLTLASVHVFIRDIAHLYSVFLRILLFLTPIFYAPTFLGGNAAIWITRLNPLAWLIQFSRTILLEGSVPSLTPLFLFAAASALALILARRWFKRMEPRFAERA